MKLIPRPGLRFASAIVGLAALPAMMPGAANQAAASGISRDDTSVTHAVLFIQSTAMGQTGPAVEVAVAGSGACFDLASNMAGDDASTTVVCIDRNRKPVYRVRCDDFNDCRVTRTRALMPR